MANFALIGVGGFVAPRHLQAIHDTGHRLVAACDPNDSVGVLDRYFPEARFFTEVERFDRHLERLRRRDVDERVQYVSVCTPNYLHDAHVRLALRVGADAICEKPLVINPWNLDQLAELEHETGRRVHTVLQLRLGEAVQRLKARLADAAPPRRVDLTYVTRRGHWYGISWKGSEEKSGGLTMNVGVHFFDLLLWLFGPIRSSALHLYEPGRAAGRLEFAATEVRWLLSIDAADLPPEVAASGRTSFRSLSADGEELELSDGFTEAHTAVYREILAGRGFGLADARPSIELVYELRHATVVRPVGDEAHPGLHRRG